MSREQLTELCKPFPKQYLGKDDRGNDAVDHTVVTQRLLDVVGPYSMEVKEVLRSEVGGMKTKSGKEYPGGHFVTGVVVTLHLNIDGREVSVDETGACENAAMKDGDGERLKHAISDAIKRCAMRLGLGLHMWAQGHYYLYDKLTRPEVDTETGEISSEPAPHGSEDGASGSRSVSPPASSGVDAPTTSDPEGEDGEAPPSGEEDTDPPLPIADQAKLRATFMAIVQGDNCGLSYEGDVKPFLQAHYDGRSWSDLTAGEKQKLVNVLTKGRNQAEKKASQEAFAAKVRQWAKEAAA